METIVKYLKIKNNLFLTEQEVKVKAGAVPTKVATNHIWIYDRSGSMYGELPGLCKDMIERAKQIPVGDTITLGWFSGTGERNFMLKGFKIGDKQDYKVLEDTIKKNSSTVGMTCFSQILEDTDQILKDLSVFGDSFALCFLTDGYPTVYPMDKEVKSIHAAIAKIEGRISSSILVGYGNYYNKELMSQMAEKLGGSLIHCSVLPEFSMQLTNFITDSSENEKKLMVALESDVKEKDVVFSLNNSQINTYAVDKGEINFIPKKKGGNYVYALVTTAPGSGEEVDLDEVKKDSVLRLTRAAYAASFILVQKTKTDAALEVLSVLGDKHLIDTVSVAFTNEEYGKAEGQIKQAVIHPNKRLLKGKDTKYLPKEDAYCLLNALDTLMSDEEAKFYPYDPSFVYQKIAASTKTKGDYPKFEANKSMACPLSQLTWNESKLNLSMLARIEGTIKLKDGFKKLGFSEDYPTYVWRNYALVKDGFLNMRALPVTLSESSFDELQDNGVIDSTIDYRPGEVIVLNLDRIPVINRAIANGKTSAKEICKKVFEETKLKAQLKALNFIKSEIDPTSKKLASDTLSDEQVAFLEANGIGKNGFAPPQEKVEPTDKYMAKEFCIDIKGLSSLPKVDDVRKKVEEKKALTPAMELVKSGLELYSGDKLSKSTNDKVKVSFVDGLIKGLKYDLARIRSDIQATKFAIILGKKWFDEFDSRENNKLTVEGREYTIGVSEVEVKI